MITLAFRPQFSPEWFSGIDLIFEILGLLVTLAIGIYSYKFYRFSKNYRYKFMGLSFLSISAAFLAKIPTYFVLYYHSDMRAVIGDVVVQKFNLIPLSFVLRELAFGIYAFLMLLGLMGIYWLISKSDNKEHIWFFIFLLFIISMFSYNLIYIYHLTAAFILLFIVKHYHTLCFRKKNKNRINAHLNFAAFFALFLSQIISIFIWVDKLLYVIAESLLLIGFIIFLVNLWFLVFGYGKKKNKD